MNPKVEDTGKYTINIGGVESTAFLNVEEADPVYTFTKNLKKKYEGFTQHELTLECTVSNSLAIVSWWKDTTKLENGEQFLIGKELSGICKLQIKNCDFDDAGNYFCKIEKQTDKTETVVKIVGKCAFLTFYCEQPWTNIKNLLFRRVPVQVCESPKIATVDRKGHGHTGL